MKLEFFPQQNSKPVLLIYDGTPNEVSTLQTAFRQLPSSVNDQLLIHLLPGMESVDGCKLSVRLSQFDEGVKRLNEKDDFEWLLTAARREDIAEMLEGFKKPWVAGHSFLAPKSKISVIISTGRGW